MREKSWSLACILVIGLFALMTPGSASWAMSEPPPPDFTGTAEIDGPLQLQISVSPPVASPRDEITVELKVTSQLENPVAPTVEIRLPTLVHSSMARLPAATTLDYQHNALSWQPLLHEIGDSESLSLQYEVSVADMTQPEHTIEVQLRHDDETSTATVTFWIGSPPSAHITMDRPVVAVGQIVTLQAVPGGPGPFTATWDLGDGRHVTAQEAKVAFAAPGIYEVRLQLANPLSVATAISSVSVVSQPTAAFALDDERPVVGQTIQFTNESGGERPFASHWAFGDGAESQDANPSHMYTAPGTYMVSLTVSSQYGRSQTTIPVTVGANPIADIVLPEQATVGAAIEGLAFGDDSITRMTWQMGDGAQYEGQSITHTYLRPGDYVVRFIAENEFGATERTTTLHVEGGRYAHFIPLVIREQQGAPAAGAAQQPAAPADDDMVSPQPEESVQPIELPVVTPSATGSVPVPGGASAGLPQSDAQPIALPPQAELAQDATLAEQLLWYVNEARRLHGLPPLAYNYELSIAAQQHTLDMSQNPDIMHIGSDGSRPAERQRRFGYLGAYGGEAVAWGWESPIPVVEFWVNSPPHRILILNPDADEIGVGHTADGRAPNIWYWAIEFGIVPNE